MEDSQKLSAIKQWLGTGSINIFGRPFAGKDTHGHELVNLFDGVLLGGGDILRNSVIPSHVQEDMNAGILIPTDEFIRIVTPFLSQDNFSHQPLILSSVGRWHGEEVGVIEATAEAGHPIKAVIYLDLSEDNVRERWQETIHSGGRGEREDDAQEKLEVRLVEFNTKTLPVIDYYRDLGILIEIDSSLEKHIVLNNIINGLYELSQRAD